MAEAPAGGGEEVSERDVEVEIVKTPVREFKPVPVFCGIHKRLAFFQEEFERQRPLSFSPDSALLATMDAVHRLHL